MSHITNCASLIINLVCPLKSLHKRCLQFLGDDCNTQEIHHEIHHIFDSGQARIFLSSMDRALRPATAKVRVCFPAKPELFQVLFSPSKLFFSCKYRVHFHMNNDVDLVDSSLLHSHF